MGLPKETFDLLDEAITRATARSLLAARGVKDIHGPEFQEQRREALETTLDELGLTVDAALAASATDEGPNIDRYAGAERDAYRAGYRAGVARPAAPVALDVELENRVRRIVERTANMGGCSQTHHEHLASDASKVYAALLEPSDD